MRRIKWIFVITIIFGMGTAAATVFAQEELHRSGRYYVAELSRTFKVKEGGTLEIRRLRGDISVSGWEKSGVEVREKVKMDIFTKSEAQKGLDLVKKTLMVTDRSIFIDGSDYRSWMNVDVVVKVPMRFNTKLNTRGGDILLENLKGYQTLSTSGGDVRLLGLNGQIQARTSGGDISVKRLKGTITLATSGGDLDLRDIAGVLSGSTSGGDITLINSTDRVSLSTSGGDIRIVNSRGDLMARTSGGDINVRESGGKVNITTSGGDISLNKASGNVIARTSGGDIDLYNILKNVVAKTSGGDLNLENIGGSIKAVTSGGEITIKNAGASVEARTSGGNVSVDMNTTDFAKDHHADIASSGGDLELALPAKLPATIFARIEVRHKPLSDFSISSDFPLNLEKKGKYGWNRIIEATGDINGGGDRIKLQTVNGNITIKKR